MTTPRTTSQKTSARALAHAEVRRRILEVAREHVATQGAGQLSLRAVVKEVGMVSSAIYRYFPSRDALVTALLLESYESLAQALEASPRDGSTRDRFLALAHSLVSWSQARPAEFSLLYGTPVPGYVAPPETVEPAARVMRPFLEVLASVDPAPETPVPVPSSLSAQARGLASALDIPLAESSVLALMAALSILIGALTLQLDGHFVGTFEPADELLEHLCQRAADTAGL